MKVAFYGNIANTAFQVVRALREHTDVDAHLFLNRADPGTTLRPESDDPSLAGRLPAWIHDGDYFTRTTKLAPWRSPLLRELSSFDALVVSGNGPVVAQFADVPWAFFVTGADLTITPFPVRFWGDYARTVRDRAAMLAIGLWQRRGVRRADEIWSQEFWPFRLAVERLHIDPARIADVYLPVIFDTARFRDDSQAGERGTTPITAPLAGADFVVFHPSRLIIEAGRRRRETGDWKANDVLIRGFAAFARSGAATRPVLALPDRAASPDVALAKDLVRELGAEEHVVWLKPPRSHGFTRHELMELYAAADVAADDFGVGWFGAVVLEALTLGRPVISHLDYDVMAKMYPWHPVVEAATPDEVAARLHELHADPVGRRDLGRRGRQWVEEFHSPEAVAHRYEDALSAFVARHAG